MRQCEREQWKGRKTRTANSLMECKSSKWNDNINTSMERKTFIPFRWNSTRTLEIYIRNFLDEVETFIQRNHLCLLKGKMLEITWMTTLCLLVRRRWWWWRRHHKTRKKSRTNTTAAVDAATAAATSDNSEGISNIVWRPTLGRPKFAVAVVVLLLHIFPASH